MNTGVYIIFNKVNGKYYIGSTTVSFKRRFNKHKLSLRKGVHHSVKLQNAWNKYGEDNFEFEILEEYPKNICSCMEQWWINMTECYKNNIGYNICSQVGTTLGYKFSNEQRKHISDSLVGKYSGENHPMWGKKREPTTLGYKHTPECIERMKFIQQNRVRSEEEIEKWNKLLKTQKGKNHPRFGIKLVGEELERVRSLRKNIPSERSIPILIFDLDDNFLQEVASMTEAAKICNTTTSKVSQICRGYRKSVHKKYTFKIKII